MYGDGVTQDAHETILNFHDTNHLKIVAVLIGKVVLIMGSKRVPVLSTPV